MARPVFSLLVVVDKWLPLECRWFWTALNGLLYVLTANCCLFVPLLRYLASAKTSLSLYLSAWPSRLKTSENTTKEALLPSN